MLGYLNYIRISDGQHSVNINGATEITIRDKDGRITKVLTGDFNTGRKRTGNYPCYDYVLGHETKDRAGALIERERYGVEYRDKEVRIPYAPKTWNGIHGTIKRKDELWNAPAIIHTAFKRGRFIKQSAYWRNGEQAYVFNRGDTEVKARYPKGITAIEVKGIGINYKDNWNLKETLRIGESILSDKEYFGDNFSFIQYDRRSRVKHKGAFKNKQRTGKWIVNYKRQAFWQGIMIDEDLLDAKPEDIPTSRVLKTDNAQVRAMLIGKIGLQRLCKELKVREIDGTIDKLGNPMRLLELPVRADDGNGNENGSRLRVLNVVCPSTRANYWLEVPDKVWQDGKRLEINTCEIAKQYGFQDSDNEIREEMIWLKET